MARTIAVIAAVTLAAALGGLVDGVAVAKETVMNHVILENGATTPKDIVVGPDVVARVRVAAGGYTIERRAAIARDRVLTILSDASLTPDTIAKAVTVRKMGADRAIYVGKNLFFTITTADAKATKATVDQLAKMWADNLRAALPKAKPRAAEETTAAPSPEPPG